MVPPSPELGVAHHVSLSSRAADIIYFALVPTDCPTDIPIPARPMHRGPTLLAKRHQEKVSREVASGYFFSRETHTSSRVTTVRDWRRCQLRAGGRGTGGNGGNGGNSGRCPGVNRTYVAVVVIVPRYCAVTSGPINSSLVASQWGLWLVYVFNFDLHTSLEDTVWPCQGIRRSENKHINWSERRRYAPHVVWDARTLPLKIPS